MATIFEPTAQQWIEDLLRQHAERVASRGAQYVGRVSHWRFDRREQALTCRVRGAGDEPYIVTLRVRRMASAFPESDADGLDAVCSCPYSDGGRFLCKHTFAAAARLRELRATRWSTDWRRWVRRAR